MSFKFSSVKEIAINIDTILAKSLLDKHNIEVKDDNYAEAIEKLPEPRRTQLKKVRNIAAQLTQFKNEESDSAFWLEQSRYLSGEVLAFKNQIAQDSWLGKWTTSVFYKNANRTIGETPENQLTANDEKIALETCYSHRELEAHKQSAGYRAFKQEAMPFLNGEEPFVAVVNEGKINTNPGLQDKVTLVTEEKPAQLPEGKEAFNRTIKDSEDPKVYTTEYRKSTLFAAVHKDIPAYKDEHAEEKHLERDREERNNRAGMKR